MAIVEISVVPIGTETTGVSAYVAGCIDALKLAGVAYRLTSMGTEIEGPVDELFKLMRVMHEKPFDMGCRRVYTVMKLDDRRDKVSDMKSKIRSVEEQVTC
ncbi:MAG: MTH1187 family thiamine-binding protein [Spartobacteria bacterium]|nr:MTH1187 family thiamine-binding protein [Spartobacteria bacterium]